MTTLSVTVYTAGPACQACTATKWKLDGLGISYAEIPISSDDGIIDAAIELGLTTAPIVCATTPDGDEYWDGYRPDRLTALRRNAS